MSSPSTPCVSGSLTSSSVYRPPSGSRDLGVGEFGSSKNNVLTLVDRGVQPSVNQTSAVSVGPTYGDKGLSTGFDGHLCSKVDSECFE